MTVQKSWDDKALTLTIEGRLDTVTAPELETILQEELADVTALTLDLAELAYISSAGLRVLLRAQKKLAMQGAGMTVCNANEIVMEVFEVTGFTDILNIR